MGHQDETAEPNLTTFQVGSEKFTTLSFSTELPAKLCQQLNATEQDICQKTLAGLSTIEIADSRGSSVHTVENQIQALYNKLGLHSRTELMVLAVTAAGK